MKRKSILLISGALLLGIIGFSAPGFAGVNFNIGINLPLPALVVPAQPPVVLIPGTYAYYVPNVDVDILFYHGGWYRPYDGRWYRGRSFNGPWVYLAPARVPHVLMDLPPHYRERYRRDRRIPYGQLTRNWRRWERERYWDRGDDEPRGGMGHMGGMGRRW
jgi:hypothetical protein